MTPGESQPPIRLHLGRRTSDLPSPAPGPTPGNSVQSARSVVLRPLPPPEELAPLMLAAYRGTPDDEGETLQDTVEVLRSAMDGGFGTWIPEASFVGTDGNGHQLGAVLTAREEDGTPFVAFVFTHPDHAGHGVASALLDHVSTTLAAVGQSELRLWVSTANERALRLYRHLGFVEVADTDA